MDYIQLLRDHKLKATPARINVLEAFDAMQHPISAQKLHERVSKSADLATVYRMLKDFERVGLVYSEVINGERTYYRSKKLHHHIECESCGTMKCVPCNHSFGRISGFTNIQHSMTLTGLCVQCA